jgi:hypothetical protein
MPIITVGVMMIRTRARAKKKRHFWNITRIHTVVTVYRTISTLLFVDRSLMFSSDTRSTASDIIIQQW